MAAPDPKAVIQKMIERFGGRKKFFRNIDKRYKEVAAVWYQDSDRIGRVLRAHLAVEHFLTLYLKVQNQNLGSIEDARLSYVQKVELLDSNAPLVKAVLPGLRLLGQIRNRVAHRLKVNRFVGRRRTLVTIGDPGSLVPSLDDLYRKFGEVSEAAQLLETELGNVLFFNAGIAGGLLKTPNPTRASDLLAFVNRQTLGQLLKSLNRSTDSLAELESLLSTALKERNRLSHSFYREHNFRRNSEEGRALMVQDLETIHEAIIEAYKAVMLLSGVDLDNMNDDGPLPTGHLPI